MTSGTPGSGSPPPTGEIPTVIIVCVTAIAVAGISAVVYLTAIGRPVDNLLVLIGALITPTIASLMAVRRHAVNSRKLDEIKSQVNGQLSTLIDEKSALEHQVSKLGAEPVTTPNIPRVIATPTDTVPQRTVGRHGR